MAESEKEVKSDLMNMKEESEKVGLKFSIQKLFCGIYSAFKCSFDEFVGEKVVSQPYSSAILGLLPPTFFIVRLSHLYMTTGKTVALTRWAFVDKVMSVLFNMLSRLVIAFLPRSKHLLISWLQSPSAVLLEPKKMKSVTVSIVSPSVFHEVMGLDAMILVFEC